MEGVQDVSSVWRPYSGGTSATSVSSITYTECLGCRAYERERATLEGGNRVFEEEETVDASSGKGGRLFTSSGKFSCSEPASLELNIEGSGRGLDCLFGRKGSRGKLLVLDVCSGKVVESDIGKEENEYVRLDCDEGGNNGAGWRADDLIGWYARTGDNDDDGEATVEGTIDGALYGFVEEKCWLAK